MNPSAPPKPVMPSTASSVASSPSAAAEDARPAPWWRFGHVWLVLAGPAIVIVAGFVTLWLAVRSPDALVAEDYYRRGIQINRTLEGGDRALLPAMQGRNHAATPNDTAAPATGRGTR